MKKTLSLFVLFLLFSCNNLKEGEYIIDGTIDGLKIGDIFVEKQEENGMQLTTVDTIKIVNGKFELKGKINEPELRYLRVASPEGRIAFILEGGEINIEIDKDSIMKSKIGGTYNNDEFQTFTKESNKLQKKMMSFQSTNMDKMNEAVQKNDTVIINSLRKEYKTIQKENTDYLFGYPKTHPKSFISVLMTEVMVTNPELKLEETEKIFNSLDSSLRNTKVGKKVRQTIDAEKAKNNSLSQKPNETAPNFEGKTPNGKTISLKQSMGKVTIIDFWASWCKPCRIENPSVVAMYNELHSEGLNIIGVSLDDKLESWKKAIADDKITWTQVSNLKGWKDPIALQYNISQIPSTIILDSKGTIVARDLRGAELKAKVKELLASK